MADSRAERLARNEAMFRVANERMTGWDERHPDEQPEPYFCECSAGGCREKILLGRDEYEEIRSDSMQFAVAVGHADATIERVVHHTPRYDVVQKHEDVRSLVERTDPRH